jgi:hypothetical protein
MIAPRIICIIPALPSEIRMDTLQSVFNQTIPITHTILLTQKIIENISFPAKISKVINGMLTNIKLENYDYLLRVDADTVLPLNFVEENLKLDMDALGYGYAQIIKITPFIKIMGGKMHPDHDDGYVLAKFRYMNLKASSKGYAVPPTLKRLSGYHHGTSWFISQGELNYMYGDDPVNVIFTAIYGFNEYALFQVYGYFKAMLTGKKRFDIANIVIYRHMLKFRNPSRFLRLPIYVRKKMKEKINYATTIPNTNPNATIKTAN